MNPGAGWSVLWRETASKAARREIFTSPEGVEYIRTPSPELAEITITGWKTTSLRPLYLKRLDSTTAHLRKETTNETEAVLPIPT